MPASAGTIPTRSTNVPIPGAVWGADGEAIRELPLRPVGNADELFLFDSAADLGPWERASALLARCLVPDAGEPAALLGALAVGDREAALLHLRKLTLGDRLDAVL